MPHLRLGLGPYRLYGALTRSRQILGVNSKLEDGSHVLMWDFDAVPGAFPVVRALRGVAMRHQTASIHILRSSTYGYHAYCFQRHGWPKTLEILADTPYLDPVYFKIGVIRGYFTLRIQDKKQGKLSPVETVSGFREEDVEDTEQRSFVRYWTQRL